MDRPSGGTKTAEERQEGEKKPANQPPKPETPEQRRRRHWLIGGGVGIAVLCLVGFGIYYLLVGRYLIDTDDAYLQADNVAIAPQATGYVVGLHVTDNQRVKRGDLLVEIDSREYQARLEQAKAQVQQAQAQIDMIEADTALQRSAIDGSHADLTSAEAQAVFARQDMARYRVLAEGGATTVQRTQQSEAEARTRDAAAVKAGTSVEIAGKQLSVLAAQLEQAEANLAAAQASQTAAETDLGYTKLYAPVDGEIGNREVRLGQYVQPGAALMVLVPIQDTYLIANFKETQVAEMYRGEAVTIDIDAFPDADIHGTVDSLSPGSGSQFSLLPPENATGNFTKIVQRIPVKILIDPNDPYRKRLRPGLSVEATVDLRTRPRDGQKRLTSVAEADDGG